MNTGASEVSEKLSEKSNMSSVEFGQFALRERVAPRSIGSVKERLRHAQRVLSRREWSANRVRDVWYADPRITPDADEIRDLEEITGLRYGREELRTNEQLINRATALLAGSDPDFHRPFITALRALFGVVDRAGTE
jgi:hypothetical protein